MKREQTLDAFHVMAGHLPRIDQAQHRALLAAARIGVRAALVKGAAGRWIERIG